MGHSNSSWFKSFLKGHGRGSGPGRDFKKAAAEKAKRSLASSSATRSSVHNTGRGTGRGVAAKKAKGKGGAARERVLKEARNHGCTPGDPDNTLPWAAGEQLVLGPTRWNGSLPSYQSVAGRQCAIIVDRHVHKNGGSTMRDLFLENERLGYGLYQGYTQQYWRDDSKKLMSIAEQAVASRTAPKHFLMIEAHFGFEELGTRVLPDLKRLEKLYQGIRVECPIVFVTRIREPLAYYVSFYKWGVGFRQKKSPEVFGANFTDWAQRVPNLQSSIMVRGMAAMHAEYYGKFPRSRREDPVAADEALDAYLSQFTVVGTVERFDETLLHAADLSGLPLLLYKRNTPNNKGGFRDKIDKICPDIEECRRVIRSVAPRDVRMHQKWHPLFENRIKALGEPFAARVRDFKEQVAGAQRVWKRAPRKQTICRYHPETRPSEPELRLSNLRCPVEDNPALCQRIYAHRLFECPWQYQPNSSLTDPLGCWRPSTGFM